MTPPYVRAIVTKTKNGLFAVDPEDNVIGRQLQWSGDYGAAELSRIRARISPEDSILVLGAHIGTLAIPLSRWCQQLVAVEANPDTFELLTMNLALNSIDNIEAVHMAANDRAGFLPFLLNRKNSGGSKRVPKHKKWMYYYDNPKQVDVQAFRLDEYFKEQKFDIILVDIEGSEFHALSGMQRLLSQCKLLCIEFLPHHLKYVSEVTVDQFLAVIQPHFSKLTIPSKERVVPSSEGNIALQEMYDLDQEDEGLLFEKEEPQQ